MSREKNVSLGIESNSRFNLNHKISIILFIARQTLEQCDKGAIISN